MNNNINRINNGIAQFCKECIEIAVNDQSAKKEILRGGGSSGGMLTRILNVRPINSVRISKDALKVCIENNVSPFDYFILTEQQCRKKHKNFFKSNEKTIAGCKKVGQFVTADHNIPNKEIIIKMFELCKNNPNATVNDYKKILNSQSLDLITVEENEKINKAGLKFAGSKEERDKFCSEKIELVDLWLTPQSVIDKFWELTKLNKEECLDPCASDGRWLGKEGHSYDILPMNSIVKEKDFLTFTKQDLPKGVKHLVGNIPFSLLNEFVEKAFELTGDCYFLVNGDNIFQHYPNNIEHVYIFTGLEGNQKDNRSRCEFDVPFLYKSALWCCIVHLTKKKQKAWTIESNISNEEKRDGYHVALGKNVYIKSDVEVDKNKKISKIPVTSSIIYKNGTKVKMADGEIVDIKKKFQIPKLNKNNS